MLSEKEGVVKKKTSILLFKMAWFPPLAILGTYIALGLLFELYSFVFLERAEAAVLEKEILSYGREFIKRHEVLFHYVYNGISIYFILLFFVNFPLICTIFYFKTGYYKIAPEGFHKEFVRRNKILFWDEKVEETLKSSEE